MRTEKALKNVLTSFFSYVLLTLAGFLLRKILLINFETELVGYDGILTDLFSYIAITDLGTEGLLTYRLYKDYAEENTNRLNHLINIYRFLSITIAIITGIVCLILFFVLPIIFSNKIQFWFYFLIMYVLLAFTKISQYIFGYWRTLLTVSQQEYKAINIESLMSFIGLICKIVVLLSTRNYVLYLLLSNATLIIGYIFVFLISKKQFPNIKKEQITIKDIKDEGIIDEYKALFIINISNIVTWSSTNIFITLLFDANITTLFMNYSLIAAVCWGVITKLIYPMRSSIADMIYKEEKKVSFSFYELMDLSCFFIASIILCGYIGVFQQAISYLFGDMFLLPMSFVFCYSLQNYFGIKSESTTSFRNAFGKYDIERKYALPCAISGILFPIIFAKLFGVGGIFIGMIIPIVIKWQCGNIIVFKEFYGIKTINKLKKEIFYLFLALVEGLITLFITKNISYSLIGVILCSIISVFVPLIINIIVFYNNDYFKGIILLIKSFIFKKQN